ncbi:hypothetical protein [Streptomyces aidingensis]|uniref:Excreted virulence factor EspC, type VII ESX diderm n=1 Tax=Streptomyces aidingensis TaxID=910347 RepID=A0A1I1TJ88_9ACTN|nr:hypothetical protein [Streptomyces aidingensis]SFD55540.1 hypothetical protein SAMN05421773_11914 [Streptomyces aidingensis]
MAANVSITYQDVEECAAAMKSSNANVLTPAKDAAKDALNTAVTTALVMPETSRAIEDKFNEIYDQLTLLCEAVDSFADQFIQIKDGMEDFDHQYAENIRNPK